MGLSAVFGKEGEKWELNCEAGAAHSAAALSLCAVAVVVGDGQEGRTETGTAVAVCGRLFLQARGLVVKSFGCLSSLQRERLAHRPPVPPLCVDPRARARPMKQVLCKDPYTQRQVLMHYPYLSNSTLFYLHEVESDKNAAPANFGLRVGFVLLSRQSPGVLNVLWGLHERLKTIRGKCLAFLGLRGLINKEFIEVTDELLELFLNQGGCELTGRSTRHSLGSKANQEAVRLTCEQLMLDGLVMPGSAFAMSESALLAEYFLARQCRTSIIGVPATGSNNLAGEFIETCVGFDSSTKVYAALIGNVLTDAASMPKYWHFVRLMGRQPSFEVRKALLFLFSSPSWEPSSSVFWL